MHICISLSLSLYIYIYTHICIHACIHACMHACTHTHTHTHIHMSRPRAEASSPGTERGGLALILYYGQFSNEESMILEFGSNEFLRKGGGLS